MQPAGNIGTNSELLKRLSPTTTGVSGCVSPIPRTPFIPELGAHSEDVGSGGCVQARVAQGHWGIAIVAPAGSCKVMGLIWWRR